MWARACPNMATPCFRTFTEPGPWLCKGRGGLICGCLHVSLRFVVALLGLMPLSVPSPLPQSSPLPTYPRASSSAEVLQYVYIYGGIAVLLFATFCLLRPHHPRLFYTRNFVGLQTPYSTSLQSATHSLWGWMCAAFRVTDAELVQHAGCVPQAGTAERGRE